MLIVRTVQYSLFTMKWQTKTTFKDIRLLHTSRAVASVVLLYDTYAYNNHMFAPAQSAPVTQFRSTDKIFRWSRPADMHFHQNPVSLKSTYSVQSFETSCLQTQAHAHTQTARRSLSHNLLNKVGGRRIGLSCVRAIDRTADSTC